MPGGAPRYARPTQSFSTRRFNNQSARLRNLTEELSAVQERLIGRLGDYRRECEEADVLAHRALQLTNRLKEVRERLQLAVTLRQRMSDVEGMMAGGGHQYHASASEDDFDPSALPGLGIDDDCVVIAHDRLPTYEDNLDAYVEDAPQEYLCPITCTIMRDPVKTSDGSTYERAAIEEWMRSFRGDTAPTSPLTNLPLTSLEVVPNTDLKRVIDAWAASLPPKAPPTPPRPGSPAARANPLAASLIWQGVPSGQTPPASSSQIRSPDRSVLPERLGEVDRDLIAAVEASLREPVRTDDSGAHWNDMGGRVSEDLAQRLADVGEVSQDVRQRERELLEEEQMRRAIQNSLRDARAAQEVREEEAVPSWQRLSAAASSHPAPAGGGAGAIRALRPDSSHRRTSSRASSSRSRSRDSGPRAGRRSNPDTSPSAASSESPQLSLGLRGEAAPTTSRPRGGGPIWSSSVVPSDEKDADLLNRLHHGTASAGGDVADAEDLAPPAGVEGTAVPLAASARAAAAPRAGAPRVSGDHGFSRPRPVQGAPGARRSSLRTLLHTTVPAARQPPPGATRARSLNYRTARPR
eukprot:TRINITY_DN21042_c0_g1_i1.p1 TRINITY_DN21042_c0_g1~~TRINITY_DN21042_c0_g1_i1.p1  ORF type:complete len:580 (+),score=104.38 TRINITY_DN21042_c0_g1_i1:59-1798(+)